LGHLFPTINIIYCVYRSKGNIAVDAPINPPSVAVYKDNATKMEIAEENRQHKARHLEFVIWHTVDAVLRNLIITRVPDIFIAAKKKTVTGFGNVTFLELLTHLHDTCGQITEKELEDNMTRKRTQWNPLTDIDSLFVQI
jgi:hypothetical protein